MRRASASMGVEVTDRAVGFACEKLGKGGYRAVRPPPLKADPEWAREPRRQGVEIWLIPRRLGVSRVTVWKHLKEAR